MIVRVKNLCKTYGTTKAIENISFEVNENEIFGLIGPDGAGKTTIMQIAATLVTPDSGTAEVCGMEVNANFKALRKHIGYMPGKFSLYPDLSIEENIQFFAALFGTTVQENYHLVSDIYSQIEPFKHRPAGKLSGGMKQKLALSCALIHKPKLLILDEPTTGVDAVSRKEFWGMLKNLQKKGISILVSTPYMDEAALCDRVALMQGGKILQIDTPQAVVSTFDEVLYAVTSDKVYKMKEYLKNTNYCKSVHLFGQEVHVTLNTGVDIDNVVTELWNTGFSNVEIKAISPIIEDCFMKLMVQ
jgi:ABC-type multidrug transport system ATPase subunit